MAIVIDHHTLLMATIDRIELKNMLPLAFEGMQGESFIRDSQVWLSDFVFERGQKYTVAAESGAGKTSLCSYIYGNRKDYIGSLYFDGCDTRDFSVGKWCGYRKDAIAFLPQEMRLFPELTAMENVRLKNRLTRFYPINEILDMFERLGIGEKVNTIVAKMSVGQQQRVAAIRALCQPFSFLILDEPVSHLDECNNTVLANLIEEKAHAQGAGIISTSVGNPLALGQSISVKL